MPQEEEEPLTFRPLVVDDAIRRVLGAVARDPYPRILIDGRSGAGKTTIALRVADELDARVVSLDEFYPGWSGLATATEIAGGIVRDHRAGALSRYRRWDWERHAWAQHCAVEPERPLVIEGCGVLTASSASDATASMWLDGDANARYAAAMARDGDGFRARWEMWARQERIHMRTHDPAGLADIAASVC